MHLCQPFGPTTEAMIELRRVTRETKQIGNDLPKSYRVAFNSRSARRHTEYSIKKPSYRDRLVTVLFMKDRFGFTVSRQSSLPAVSNEEKGLFTVTEVPSGFVLNSG